MAETPTDDLHRWSVVELQEWARRLTDQGWVVTPMRVYRDANGHVRKEPFLENWLQRGALTGADIRSFSRWRMSHLGLVLGPDHVGLDFENKGEANVQETYRLLRGSYGDLPSCPNQKTLTGGFHALQRIDPERIRRFSRRIRLPDGDEVAADVVRKGFLCLTLYDPAFPGVASDSDEIPWLPDRWYPAIQAPMPRNGESSGRKAANRASPGTQQFGRQAQTIAAATVQHRNNTLFDSVREVVLAGRWTDQLEREVSQAALAVGLDQREIAGTIASVVRYGLDTIWGGCLAWLARVHLSGIQEPSEVWDLACLLCARIVAANRACDEPFAISDREFSEHLGINSSAARRRLQSLVDHGLLAKHAPRSAFHLPTSYRLLSPGTTGEYRPSHSEEKNARALDRGEGMGRYAAVVRALARVELGRHSAFQQIGEGPWLPRAGIRILDALSTSPEGFGSKSEIARVTGLDRGTLRRSVDDLLDADIVVCEGGWVRLKRPDVITALDEWCDLYEVPDRIALRRERHEQERKALDLYDLRKYRGRYGPKAVRGRVSFNPEEWDAVRLRQERDER